MKVKDVMTREVVSVSEDMPFKEVVETLLRGDVSGAPVIDAGGRIVGIVSEADLLSKEAYPATQRRGILELLADLLAGRHANWAHKASGLTARDIMTSTVETAAPDEDARSVARRMIRHGIKRLPVVEGGRVAGIVSRQDLLRVFARPDAELKAAAERLLVRNLFVPPDHEVRVGVADGVVTLEGTVEREDDVRVAEAIVARLDGVVGVKNALLFREMKPHYARHASGW